MKKIFLILTAFAIVTSVLGQKNTLTNTPDYQIFKDNIEKLIPSIPVTRKELKKEEGLWETLEVQSSQNSEDKNDINILVVVTRYISNPLNINPLAAFIKTARTLDQNLSLKAAAFTEFEGNADDDIIKNKRNLIYSQINIDPEEASDFRVKKGGEKMKNREFGSNVDAMFNYVNSLLKGSFHDAEAKWYSGKEFHHSYYAAAGNVVVKVKVGVYGKNIPPEKSPDARKIANEILKKLPQDRAVDIASNFEIYPKLNPYENANENGLIPASSLLPAKVILKVGKPDELVTFSLLVTSSGELRSENQQGKSISVFSDSKGEAIVWYYYTDKEYIKEPVKIVIVGEVGGKSRKATINVGLGLAFDQLKEIPEQVYIYANEKPYAFAISVKSLFFPNLNVPLYIRAAHESQIWGDKKIGVELISTWINMPDDAVNDEFYVGTAFIESSTSGDNSNVLVANRQPMQYYSKLSYPAVILKSQGTHIYKVNGRMAVLDGASDGKKLISYMIEEMSNSPALIPLSAEYPERWYKSVACALASVQTDKMFFLVEAAKLVPSYGMIADLSTTASSFLCGILNGEYEKSILDLASWVGGQYIDNLREANIFNKLTKTSQDAVLAAKTTYYGTDMYKKKTELEQIRAKQKELMRK